MLTNDTLGNKGRLGNVLFQYAALKSKSIDLNCEIIIPNPKSKYHDGQQCQLQYFNINCKIVNVDECHRRGKTMSKYIENINYGKKGNTIGNMDPGYKNIKINTNLNGFFENEEYFKHNKEIIEKEFTLKSNIKSIVQEKINKIRKQYPNYQIIGLHLRRGDIIEKNFKSNTACKKLTKETWLYQYLEKAFKYFDDIPLKKFLVFTGGSTNSGNNNFKDMRWCKDNFKGDEFIFAEKNSTIIDFGMLKECDHMILTTSSTFGWWAGYLNRNRNKKIICSKTIEYSIQPNKDWEKFWPDNFIKIG